MFPAFHQHFIITEAVTSSADTCNKALLPTDPLGRALRAALPRLGGTHQAMAGLIQWMVWGSGGEPKYCADHETEPPSEYDPDRSRSALPTCTTVHGARAGLDTPAPRLTSSLSRHACSQAQ